MSAGSRGGIPTLVLVAIGGLLAYGLSRHQDVRRMFHAPEPVQPAPSARWAAFGVAALLVVVGTIAAMSPLEVFLTISASVIGIAALSFVVGNFMIANRGEGAFMQTFAGLVTITWAAVSVFAWLCTALLASQAVGAVIGLSVTAVLFALTAAGTFMVYNTLGPDGRREIAMGFVDSVFGIASAAVFMLMTVLTLGLYGTRLDLSVLNALNVLN